MTDLILIPRELFAFLCGDGPMQGHWFGEKPEHEQGNFWWRKALRAADNRMIDAETIKGIILAFIDADDATHWGDFEKALDLAIGKEPMRYREALVAIDNAVIAGRVCDDVAWFDKHITLHDFILGELEPSEPAVVADLTAHLEEERREDPMARRLRSFVQGTDGNTTMMHSVAGPMMLEAAKRIDELFAAQRRGQEFDAGEGHRLAHAWLDENFSDVPDADFSAADMERAFLAGLAQSRGQAFDGEGEALSIAGKIPISEFPGKSYADKLDNAAKVIAALSSAKRGEEG